MDPQRKLDELETVLEKLKAICVEVHVFISYWTIIYLMNHYMFDVCVCDALKLPHSL